jgi:hypothetical protein
MRRLLVLSGQSPDVTLWRLPALGVPPRRSRRQPEDQRV